MARLLLLILLLCAIVALIGAAAAAWTRAAREGQTLARDLTSTGGSGMERISYAALILLMLGVTSGLLGGL
ncbi:hypothetical protein [Roseovarius sp. Pro17]|uniref:hypothetical protein n=1 Tax=Roseovarius sp. Pro17 TaxID=3108175 RepID=UPI002D786E4A|nr:hypothetical protein [Roseovarius sp. Pro17]